MKPFEEKPIKKSGLIGKLLGLHDDENFIIELNNLLAKADTPSQITAQDVENLLKKYRLDNFIGKRLVKGKIKELIEKYVHYLVEEQKLRESTSDIQHLLSVLGLSTKDVKDIAKRSLENLLLRATEDKRFDETEKAEMKALIDIFNLSENEAEKVYSQALTKALSNYISEAVRDGDWSPEEEETLLKFAEEFNVKPNLDPDTQKLLNRLRLVWEAQHGKLPSIPVNIKLQRGEVCHFHTVARLAEWKKEVVSQSYSGPRISFRVAKGIYLSHGTYKRHREVREVLKEIDQGDLYLTNKRALFKGSRKSISLPFNKIIDVDLYTDGVYLYKESGKPVILLFSDAEKFGVLLTALWQKD